MAHFTVVCLAAWPMTSRGAGGDLALMQTSLLFSCNCKLVSIRKTWFTQQKQRGLYQTRSPLAPLPFKGQVTEQITVTWSIRLSSLYDVSYCSGERCSKQYKIIIYSTIKQYWYHIRDRQETFMIPEGNPAGAFVPSSSTLVTRSWWETRETQYRAL